MLLHRLWAAALLMLSLVVCAAAQELVVREGVSANLRSGPGTNFIVAGRVAPGAVLEQLGRDETDREWIMVRQDDTGVYIHQSLVTRRQPVGQPGDPETVMTMHRSRFGKLNAAALSSDGALIAIHEYEGDSVMLWRYPDLVMLKTLPLPLEPDEFLNVRLDFLTDELLHVMTNSTRSSQSVVIDIASSVIVYHGPSYFGSRFGGSGDGPLRVAGRAYPQRILDPVTLETLRITERNDQQVTMTTREGRRQPVKVERGIWVSPQGRLLRTASGEGPGGTRHVFVMEAASGDEVRRSFALSDGERVHGYNVAGDVVLTYRPGPGDQPSRYNAYDFLTGEQITFFSDSVRFSSDYRYAATRSLSTPHISSYDLVTRKSRLHASDFKEVNKIFPLGGSNFLVSSGDGFLSPNVFSVLDVATDEKRRLGGGRSPAQIVRIEQWTGNRMRIHLEGGLLDFDPLQMVMEGETFMNRTRIGDDRVQAKDFSVEKEYGSYIYWDKVNHKRYEFKDPGLAATTIRLAHRLVEQYRDTPDFARMPEQFLRDAQKPIPRGRIRKLVSPTEEAPPSFEAEFDQCKHVVRLAAERQLCIEPANPGHIHTGRIIEVNFETGKVLRESRDLIANRAKSMMISLDGKYLYVATGLDEIVIFAVSTLRKLASLHVFDNGKDWIIVTPEGFYGGGGDTDTLLGVTYGVSTTHSINRFRNSLFRPDLVVERLTGDAEGLVRDAVAALSLTDILTSGEAPDVAIELLNHEGDRAEVSARLTDTGGGIGRVEWRVNGVAQAHAENRREFRATLNLAEGENRIQLVAGNGRNLIEARSEAISITVENARKPRLFIMSLGVNDYLIEDLHLKHATIDAQALAPAIARAGEGLYEEVFTEILLDEQVTRTNLDRRFRELADAIRPNDVFVFFAAGHGKTIDGRFFFIPQDFSGTTLASLRERSIGHSTWQEWFALIPAQKSLLLFDSCESGTLTDAVTGRDLRFQAASDVLGNALGRALISASSGTGVALEGYNGHGVFTYAILEALKSADMNGDGVIDIDEFASSVEMKVPEIALEAFGESQQPQFKAPQRNFDILRQTQLQ